MITHISHAPYFSASLETAKPAPAKSPSLATELRQAPSTQVKLSAAGQAAAKAAEEASETPAQTAREAASGDTQAIRLQARQSLAKTYR